MNKADISSLVRQADREILENLVVKQSSESKRFYLEALSVLGGSPEQELAAVKDMMEQSVERNIYRGRMDKAGRTAVCQDMTTALKTAQHCIDQKQYMQAIKIAHYILVKCIEVINDTCNSSGSLLSVMGDCENILSCCIEEVDFNCRLEEKPQYARYILQMTKEDGIQPWQDLCCELLTEALPLADKKCADEISALLKK